MRNKIFGAIGVIWGGSIIVNWFLLSHSGGDQAFQFGKNAAATLGSLMLIAGVHYFFKKPNAKSSYESE